MNKTELTLAAKAARHCGIKVTAIKSITRSGSTNLFRKYNQAGDSQIFDPYQKLDDSMMLAMMAGVDVYLCDEFVSVTDKQNNSYNITIKFSANQKKSKPYRIGNAIINVINERGASEPC